MAKFDKAVILPKINIFDMTLLHAHAQYIYIMYAKYQMASVKVDFPLHPPSEH